MLSAMKRLYRAAKSVKLRTPCGMAGRAYDAPARNVGDNEGSFSGSIYTQKSAFLDSVEIPYSGIMDAVVLLTSQ